MSREGLRKVTQGWGRKVSEKREEEAYALFDIKENPSKEIVTVTSPIEKQASISTDGGFVHIREDGWKEVKGLVMVEYSRVAIGCCVIPT